MAVGDRGSMMWFMLSATQLWLSFKLMEDVSVAVTTLFGSSAAACLILGITIFRQEQRELLLNPMKVINKEVHPEEMAKQGKGAWMGIALWIFAIITGSIILP
jgi:hypothetical protein